MRMDSRSVLRSVRASPGRGDVKLLLQLVVWQVSTTQICRVSVKHTDFWKSKYLQQFADNLNELWTSLDFTGGTGNRFQDLDDASS